MGLTFLIGDERVMPFTDVPYISLSVMGGGESAGMNLRTREKATNDRCRNPKPLCGTTATCAQVSIFSVISMPTYGKPIRDFTGDRPWIVNKLHEGEAVHPQGVCVDRGKLEAPPPSYFGQNRCRDAPRIQS